MSASPKPKVVNEVSTKGALLCVVCNKPAVWVPAPGTFFSSPMRRVKVRNLDALAHECCLPTLYADMAAQLKRALFVSRIRDVARGAGRFLVNTVKVAYYVALYPFAWVIGKWRRA